MLRIVGVQRSPNPQGEFVLLQNQGSLRVVLKGQVLLAERSVLTGDLAHGAHVFSEEEAIHPGLYVVLTTGCGLPHWGRSKDGAHVYHAFAGRAAPLWNSCDGPIHVLSPCHTFVERPEALLLR